MATLLRAMYYGKTFYGSSYSKQTGTMPNRGAVTNTITTQGGSYTIPAGYHNGSGKVTANFANLIPSNIKKGVNIGGVVGTLKDISSISSVTITYETVEDGGGREAIYYPSSGLALIFLVAHGLGIYSYVLTFNGQSVSVKTDTTKTSYLRDFGSYCICYNDGVDNDRAFIMKFS